MLFFLCMGASGPLLPKFVVDELGGTEASAGVVTGSLAASALITRSGFGRLGGRRGARLLMLIGASVGSVGMALFIVATSVPMAILARLVLGAGQASLMTASTALAIDLAPEDRRGEASSYILTAFHLGLGTGPLLGEAILAHSSYTAVWALLTVPMALSALVSSRLPNRGGDPDAPPSPWIHRSGIAPGAVTAIVMMPFAAFATFIPLYGRDVIGLDEVGTVYMMTSITIAFVRIFLGRLPDALGPIRSGTVALVMVGAGAGVASLWPSTAGVYLTAGLFAGGVALQTPALIPVAVRGVAPRDRASAMATFTMFLDLAIAAAGPIVGLLVGWGGYQLGFAATGVMVLPGLAILYGNLAPRWSSPQAKVEPEPVPVGNDPAAT
jgi:MFS family permease